MKRLIAGIIIAILVAIPVFAAAPIQSNPNTLQFTGVDDTTGNAAAPYVNHLTGIAYVTTEGVSPTYAAGVASYASMAANTTDVFCITGSASKLVKVDRVQITADATASGSVDVILYKRTAIDVGGTSAPVTGIAYDSTSPSYTSVVKTYSANPSGLGTGNIVRSDTLELPATANGYPNSPIVWDFGTRNSQYLTLRGVVESACINLNGFAVTSGESLHIDVEWMEQ